MKKYYRLGIVLLVVAIIGSGIIISASKPESLMTRLGILLGNKLNSENQPNDSEKANVAAIFKGHEISMDIVEYYYQVRITADPQCSSSLTYRDIVDELVRSRILAEEAEKTGLAATPEEIELQIQVIKDEYEKYEEMRTTLDDYCAGAGISLDEYFDLLRETVPGLIAKTKFYQKFANEWCEENQVMYSEYAHSQELMEGVNAKIDGLVEPQMSDIVYCIDQIQ